MNLIDWEKSGRFIGKQTYATKKTLTKFVHGWLKSGKENHGDKTICPFCQVMEDDTTEHNHFLLCPASWNQKKVRLEAFEKLLTKIRPPEDLKRLLYKGLESYYYSATPPNVNRKFKSINTEQNIIGWKHFTRGGVTTSMEKEMTKVYRTMSNRPRTFTGKGCIRMVIEFNLTTHLTA